MTDEARGLALVTGAAKRIGATIAAGLAADGWAVALHYNTSADEAEALAERLRSDGAEAFAIGCDLAVPEAVEGLVAAVAARAGRPLRLLLNNASLFELDHFDSFSVQSWRRHQDINLLAPILLSRAMIGQLPPSADALIVNILDQKISNLNPDFFSYTLSKTGLATATTLTAMCGAPRVRVIGVAPGLTLISGRQTPEQFERSWRATPLRRNSTPEDLLAAVRFAWDCKSMTDTVLFIDGGERMMKRNRDVFFSDG